MKQNEGAIDRIIRFLAAVILAVFTYWGLSGAWQIAAYVIAAILLITAITGFCGLYKIFGISTIKRPKPDLSSGGPDNQVGSNQ